MAALFFGNCDRTLQVIVRLNLAGEFPEALVLLLILANIAHSAVSDCALQEGRAWRDGEYPARELKAAIEWVRNPLAEEYLAEAAE